MEDVPILALEGKVREVVEEHSFGVAKERIMRDASQVVTNLVFKMHVFFTSEVVLPVGVTLVFFLFVMANYFNGVEVNMVVVIVNGNLDNDNFDH